MPALRSYHRIFNNFLRSILLVAFLTGCQVFGGSSPAATTPSPASIGGTGTGATPSGTSVSPVSQTRQAASPTPPKPTRVEEITFYAQVPAKLEQGQSLFIEFLDEVTGLALNPVRSKMDTQDGLTYVMKASYPVGSVIKYRYFRDTDPISIEYTSLDQQVRYRMYVVESPGEVHDVITAWKAAPADSKILGRIQGQVANKANNNPVTNALVTAGGMQTLTASDGSFLLEGLPPGTHNLVVYSLDGAYRAFQQGAVVATESTTPALVMLAPSNMVNVTFVVHPPKDNLAGVPVRLIGNIYPLGNTFADLRGGTSVIPSRAPLLSVLPDGRYSLSLKLPAGLDLRYKYSLGDGFWNAERSVDGNFFARQLIVPNQDTTIEDSIVTWKTPGFAPITFQVTVPDDTPVSDTISIQFNPFGWTEPMPMWPVGKNQWHYILYNPLNAFATASYRYCRNDQCGTADNSDTHGANVKGVSFNPKGSEQTFEDTVKSWTWFEPVKEPVIVPGGQIKARGTDFQAAVELMPGYHPSWQPYLVWAFQNIKDIGANTVTLTPTWHLTHKAPPVIEPVTGKDPLWLDLTQMSLQAQQKGLAISIHPVLSYPEDPGKWWQSAKRDDGWWQSWFDRYRTFLLYHADLASQTGAKSLVIGDETLLPALPGGKLADGSPSKVPGDAEQRWTRLLSDVRLRYKGKLVWMMPYVGKLPDAPGFLKNVDLLYVQLSVPLSKEDALDQASLENSIAAALDKDILKLQEKTNLPITLGLQYPSVASALNGCVEDGKKCLPLTSFQRPAADVANAKLALKDQVNAYSAVLAVASQRSWITGFTAVGFYAPVELKDLSVSIRSKPASDVLWYWYPRLTGQTAP